MELAIQRLLKEVEAGAQVADLLDSEAPHAVQERYSTNPLVSPKAMH